MAEKVSVNMHNKPHQLFILFRKISNTFEFNFSNESNSSSDSNYGDDGNEGESESDNSFSQTKKKFTFLPHTLGKKNKSKMKKSLYRNPVAVTKLRITDSLTSQDLPLYSESSNFFL
jgi:hypothetical protein